MRALTETQALVAETLEEAMHAAAAARGLHETVQAEGQALIAQVRQAGEDAARRIEAAGAGAAGKIRDGGATFGTQVGQLTGALRATVGIVGAGTRRLMIAAFAVGAGSGALAASIVTWLAIRAGGI